MATLQATKQWSATTAKTRLKQLSREQAAPPVAPPEAPLFGAAPRDTAAAATSAPVSGEAHPYHDRLAELEQRQLLLQTVKIYPGWQLVSVQHRPESDVLVAYLVPSRYDGDPVLAIRQGHAMQIIMDATGDFRVQRPRRRQTSLLSRFMRWLANAGVYSVTVA
jgi:hypothetical protein